MQATRDMRRPRTLPLLLTVLPSVLMVAACSGTSATTLSQTPSTTAALRPATTSATATTLPTTTTTRPPTTTTTTNTTTIPAPTTTRPAEIPERSVLVPTAPAPTIDGTIDIGEWDGAIAISLSNGDTAYWQRDGATLYLALDGKDVGAVNLVIATADELWILHSSAALGSSLYLPGESAWEQSHGYTWCCRSAHDDTARLGLLVEEGWQANIGYTGDVGVVEYQVAIPWGYATAALAYHSEAASAYWPTDIPPDAVAHITANQWTDPAFDPGQWWMLVPSA